MGFEASIGVSVFAVFVQGLLSFFSPCVLPLLPLYIGYLAGGSARVEPDGTIIYPRGKVLVNTVFFVAGISFAFFVLAMGFSALGSFFSSHQRAFSVGAGIVMIAFGGYMIGAFGKSQALEKERRLPFVLSRFAMNPLVALVLGFTFSFAWTPCVGPVLASVLLMAATSSSALAGFALVGVYTLGFALPFLAAGLFTGGVLTFFRRHGSVVKYTVKIGGALLIVMGLMTATGWMNGITAYLSSFGEPASQHEQASSEQTPAPSANTGSADDDAPSAGDSLAEGGSSQALPSAPGLNESFVDQYGARHVLSDYRGKIVMLNFFASWCGPCKRELPHLEAYYREQSAGDNVVVLGVAMPSSSAQPNAADASEQEIISFLSQNDVTYPVLMDRTGILFSAYSIRSFPTTFMITPDGCVAGYVPGSLTPSMIESIVAQTKTASRS